MQTMRIMEDQRIRRLLSGVFIITVLIVVSLVGATFFEEQRWLLAIAGMTAALALPIMLWRFFQRQDALLEGAVTAIRRHLAGGAVADISCDEEGEMYRLFHEINALARIADAHVETERQAHALLERTIADISHQIRTPLAALQVYNEIIADEVSDRQTVSRFCALAEGELDRIGELIERLLAMARLEAGENPLTLREENLAEIMEGVHQQFAFRAKQEGKTLAFKGLETIKLICDRRWMEEAVCNLVKNALDHTGAVGTVEVSWQQLSVANQIVVRDDGCGIPEGDLMHIFKRFYRSRTDHGNAQGIGLGLPLCKAITEAHGGTIGVESEPGQGSAFTMLLPIPTKL